MLKEPKRRKSTSVRALGSKKAEVQKLQHIERPRVRCICQFFPVSSLFRCTTCLLWTLHALFLFVEKFTSVCTLLF